jgi:peptidoglycan/xylan/chitin deacetylase (PgdA/CDA1 family)
VKNAGIRVYKRIRLGRAARRAPRDWRGVRILGYHRIASVPDPLCVAPEAFREQMHAVVASGATPISLARAIELLRGPGPIEERFVCVTFDDGYRDNLEEAVPLLRELAIPATIYVPTRVLDGEATYYWFAEPPPALSWEECDALVAEGLVDVQPHTRTHPWLPRVTDEQARDEIAGSKADLAARGYAVTSFCYPAGLHGDREPRLVREAGYEAAVTTQPGVNAAGDDLHRLRRTLVYWEDGSREFALKLAGALDAPPLLRALLYRARASGGLRRTRARSERTAAG